MIETLLPAVLAVCLITLVAVLLLWRHVDNQAKHVDKQAEERRAFQRDLETRVTRIEADQKNSMSPKELRAVYSELAEIQGRMVTMTDLMHGIQDHLLKQEQR